MKSLFSRFKQPPPPSDNGPPPPGKRTSLHLDEKDKRVKSLKDFFEGNSSSAGKNNHSHSADTAKPLPDATVRATTGRHSFLSRPPIPASQRASVNSVVHRTASSTVPDDSSAKIATAAPRPTTPGPGALAASLPVTSHIGAAATMPSAAGVRDRRPSSRASVPNTSSASAVSVSAGAHGVSITPGTSGSSARSVPRAGGSGHARTASSATTGGVRPASLVLGDIDEWAVHRGPIHRMSLDNVKKVAFQSPTRNVNASESDLRSSARSTTSGGPAGASAAVSGSAGPSRRRVSSPRRPSSPSKQQPRSVTPNHLHSGVHALMHANGSQVSSNTSVTALNHNPNPRVMSRSSSRQSVHNRKPSASGSGSLLHSPTKSTMSTLAPSDASTMSAASYLPIAECWSAAMDDELIANLGPRERARQEVLWEIVNSEERYVQDLVKLNETFCRQLLPMREAEAAFSLPDPLALTRVTSPVSSSGHADDAHLPIAAQYSRFSTDSFRDQSGALLASPDPSQGPDVDTARQNAYNLLTRSSASTNNSHGGGASGGSAQGSAVGAAAAPAVDKDKPLPRIGSNRGSSSGHKRLSFHRRNSNSTARLTSRSSSISSVLGQNGPVTLPDDLEQVLTVISSGIIDGHVKQVTALRKRYDEQFPLVRSLADVFTSHSDILREYATYILHLERALAQVDEALAMADQIATGGRRSSRRLEETQLGKLSKLLAGLEELAAERGEAGLAISLSKPFQRLLKYPLLFQNLLYNTSPSTREYEATLAMVDEVQKIVRTIEDEKTSCEERERSRDAWARIEGMERNKQLMAPKPNRLIISETSLAALRGDVPKERKGHHRLSDMLRPKHAEQWIVKFSDVSLLCDHVGNTTLPMTTKPGNLKSESMTDLSTKRMSAMGRRHHAVKSRNLYKFIKVYEWHELKPPPPRITVEKPVRRMLHDLAEATPRTPEKIIPLKTGDETPSKLTPRRRPNSSAGTYDDGMSDKMSVMSFAFRGEARPNPMASMGRMRTLALPPATRVTVTKTALNTGSHERRASGGLAVSGAAQAKFGHRLRASDDVTVRPASRVRRSLPPAMALSPTNMNALTGANGRASPIRPPWNSSMRPASVRERSDLSRPIASRVIRPKTSAGAVKDTTTAAAVTATAATVPMAADTASGTPTPAAAPPSGSGSSTNVTTTALGIWEERPGLSAATAARIARRNLGGHI